MTRAETRALTLIGLFAAELALLAASHQLLADFDCTATGAEEGCRFLRSLVGRAVAVAAAVAVLAWTSPDTVRRVLAAAAAPGAAGPWPGLHALGVALLVLPLVATGGQGLAAQFWLALGPWLAGAAAAALGGLLWLVPPRALALLAPRQRAGLAAVAGAAFLLPDAARLAEPLWDWAPLTRATFAAVVAVLHGAGAAPDVDPAAYVIGVDDFYVEIAHACSGVEGLALVTAFTALYALLFRDTIRPLRFALVVWPLALAASWGLNVLRIAALVLIGARISPTLAVEGFHSYAGWLVFSLLALGLLAGVHASPWLHRTASAGAPASGPRLRADPLAAAILSFVALMLSGVLAAAFFVPADLGYPLKVAAMAGALALFLPALRALPWRPDAVAAGAGAAVGLLWIALARPGTAGALEAALAGLAPSAFAAWIVLRLAGTVLLVPVVEELFFRGYLLARLDGPGWRRAAAVAVSTLLFAALHGAWLAAGLAGLVFAAVKLRRGLVTDAVAAHATANAVVAVWAVLRGDLGVI